MIMLIVHLGDGYRCSEEKRLTSKCLPLKCPALSSQTIGDVEINVPINVKQHSFKCHYRFDDSSIIIRLGITK